MNPAEINSARFEAGRWRPTTNSGPAQSTIAPISPAPPPFAAAPPPFAAAPPPVATAAPAPAPAAPQSVAKSTSEPSSSDISKYIKKGDVDSILDQVPQGLRKKYGF
jgi:hypothetical protein